MKFWKITILILYFRHHTLKYKSDGFIEVFPPNILGGRHEYIEVLNPNFSADEIKNWRFSGGFRNVKDWPILHILRQRIESHFKDTVEKYIGDYVTHIILSKVTKSSKSAVFEIWR